MVKARRIRHGTDGLEKGLRRYVVEELRQRGCFAYSIETETVRGVPDVLAVLPGGRFLGVELKKRGGQLSAIQQKNLEEIEKRKGAAAVVASRSEARTLFHALGLSRRSEAGPERLKQASPSAES